MAFKVGDRVKTVKEFDAHGAQVFPVGTVGVIKSIDTDINATLPYVVMVDNKDFWWYSDDMLEPYEDNTDEQSGEKSYEQGCIDLWNALSYIYSATHSERRKIIGNDNFGDILLLNPEELIFRFNMYKDRVGVNEVVTLSDGTKALVIDESSDDTVFVLTENRCMEEWPRNGLKKTGKRIDVDAIVEQIKEV